MYRRDFLTLMTASAAIGGCGVILYPERQGQERHLNQRLDGTVVALDGLLCLVFLLPGIIAFAVDFATGTVYLPKGHPRGERVLEIRVPRDRWTRRRAKTKQVKDIEQLIEQETGLKSLLKHPELMVLTGVSNREFAVLQDPGFIDPEDLLPFEAVELVIGVTGEVVAIDGMVC
jgi:hypothetical protein